MSDHYPRLADQNARLGQGLGGNALRAEVQTFGALASISGLGEPRAVIDAISRLNEAIHLARKSGWSIAVTAHEQGPDEAQTGPYRTVRAAITREV